MNDMDFYLFLEQEKRRMYQPLWYNFNLLAKGHTLQIWGPSNWKIRCPFAGEGHQIVQEDVVEGNPRWRYPRAVYNPVYINYHQDDLSTSEEIENEEQNNRDNIAEDEEYAEENRIHYDDDNNDKNNEEGDPEESEGDIASDQRDFYHGM